MASTRIDTKIELPFSELEIAGEWEPNDTERNAAWQMHVELVTRVAAVELEPQKGLCREALTSYHTLFDTTRQILKQHGPDVAQPKTGNTLTFAHLAVAILNHAIRPFLNRWHPQLQNHETKRPQDTGQQEWEQQWSQQHQLRTEINQLRQTLEIYAQTLSQTCGAQNLLNLKPQ